MAVTEITVYQDNIESSVNAMAVHSPLVFLVDVTYTSSAPDFIYCEVFKEGISKLTARCIYVADISETTRRFKFVADEILRGYMPDFDDFVQSGGSIETATNISQTFTLNFKNDTIGTIQLPIEIEAVHAARQIGENACLVDICSNANDLYLGAENKPVYVYFYNLADIPPVGSSYALDYNDDYFTDYDDNKFLIPDI